MPASTDHGLQKIYKLAFKTELLDFVSPNFYHPPSDSEGDAIISALVMLWGEVPLEWKSHWDSREGLRSICKRPIPALVGC